MVSRVQLHFQRSVQFIWRRTAFGFLGGEEVKEAGVGNLGLQDRKRVIPI